MTSAKPSARRTRAGTTSVRLDATGLWLGDRASALRAGSVHYFEIQPAAWPEVLAASRALGVTAIETPVPWSLHEVGERSYDFGDSDPRRDIRRFLALAHRAGLHAVVRAGPLVDAGLDRSGLPARITADPRFAGQSSAGHPLVSFAPPAMFATPSFASRAFCDETAHWLGALGQALAPSAWPRGPIVLLELGATLPFATPDAPWNVDHHPDALAAYRRLLKRRYRTLPRLREAHDDPRATWKNARPTASFVTDHALARRRQAAALDARDEAHDAAMATWARALRSGALAELPLVTSATQNAIPRLALGGPPWQARPSNAEDLMAVVDACARGEKRLHLHMLADATRWIGAPLDTQGRARECAEPLRQLLTALEETSCHGLVRLAPAELGFAVGPAPIELGVDCAGDRPIVAWLRNPGGEARDAELRLPRAFALRDPLDGTSFDASARLRIPLAARSARMLTIEEAAC